MANITNLNVESTFAAAGHQLLSNKHDATAGAATAGFTSNELLFQNLLYTLIVESSLVFDGS